MEKWKPLFNFENFYEVSNLGNVRSKDRLIETKHGLTYIKKGKILSLRTDTCGYKQVRIWFNNVSKNISVHRSVAIAFIPNENNKPQVNHIDGNKLNNAYSNLEWVTAQENIEHAYKIGLSSKNKLYRKGKYCYNSKQVAKIDVKTNEILETYETITKASKMNGLFPTNISLCAKNKRKTCGGFKWKFV